MYWYVYINCIYIYICSHFSFLRRLIAAELFFRSNGFLQSQPALLVKLVKLSEVLQPVVGLAATPTSQQCWKIVRAHAAELRTCCQIADNGLGWTCGDLFQCLRFLQVQSGSLAESNGRLPCPPLFKNPSDSRGRVPNFFILIGGFTTPLVIDFLAPRMYSRTLSWGTPKSIPHCILVIANKHMSNIYLLKTEAFNVKEGSKYNEHVCNLSGRSLPSQPSNRRPFWTFLANGWPSACSWCAGR